MTDTDKLERNLEYGRFSSSSSETSDGERGGTATRRTASRRSSGETGTDDTDTDTRNGNDHGTAIQSGNEAGQLLQQPRRIEQAGTDDTSGGNGNSDGNGTAGSGTGKRSPGRPKGSRNKRNTETETRTVQASVEGDTAPPKPRTRARRTTKVTGTQVEKGIVQTFGMVAMLRGPLWKVDKAEVEAWSNDAAELLNKIPASTFDRFLSASSIIAVTVGMGSIVLPRVMLEAATAKQAAAIKKAAQEAEQRTEAGVETVEASTEVEPGKPSMFGDLLQEGF